MSACWHPGGAWGGTPNAVKFGVWLVWVAVLGFGATLLAPLVLGAGVAFVFGFALATVPVPASASVGSARFLEDFGPEYPGEHCLDDDAARDLRSEDHGQQCADDRGHGRADAQVDGKDGAALG